MVIMTCVARFTSEKFFPFSYFPLYPNKMSIEKINVRSAYGENRQTGAVEQVHLQKILPLRAGLIYRGYIFYRREDQSETARVFTDIKNAYNKQAQKRNLPTYRSLEIRANTISLAELQAYKFDAALLRQDKFSSNYKVLLNVSED